MNGSYKSVEFYLLTQWYKLFLQRNIKCSIFSYKNWKKVVSLILYKKYKKDYKNIFIDNLINYYFISNDNNLTFDINHEDFSLKLNSYRLVFINGKLISELSDSNTGNWEISIEDNIEENNFINPLYPDLFFYLNKCLNKKVTKISLPENKVEKRPLYLLQINYGSSKRKTLNMINYQHSFDIKSKTNSKIIEHFVSLNNLGCFNNTYSSINIGSNAIVDYTKLIFENSPSFHFGQSDINVYNNAVFHNRVFILGKGLSIHENNLKLNGEKSNVLINSLSFPCKSNTTSIYTNVEHIGYNCYSKQIHKIIAYNNGIGMFDGLIKVNRNSTGTDSNMTNNNLILNLSSKIKTNPRLEIYSDKVKCKHGATFGQVDLEQVFYLRSRGISYQDSIRMIIFAFIIEVIEDIKYDSIKQKLLFHVENIVRNNLYDLSY